MTDGPYRNARYRDGLGPLRDFTEQMTLAVGLVDELQSVALRFANKTLIRFTLTRLQTEARQTWDRLWDRLDKARAIAVAMDRDVDAYDHARDRVAPYWTQPFDVHREDDDDVAFPARHRVTWDRAPLEIAMDAISSLKQSVPEAMIPKTPDLVVDRVVQGWFFYWWLLLVVVFVIAIVVTQRCFA